MKLFEFDIHIGDWRVLVQSKDIQNGAIQGRHIAEKAITGKQIAPNTIEGRNIGDEEITGDHFENDTIIPGKLAAKAVSNRNLQDKSIDNRTLADKSVNERNLQDKSVKRNALDDKSVGTRALQDDSVTPDKLKKGSIEKVVIPMITPVDNKYSAITKELYSMIRSLQVGGLALSNRMGDSEEIGITQKSITRMIKKIWNKLADITGEGYNNFTMTITPTMVATENAIEVTVQADSYGAISYFDSIRIYANNVLVAENEDVVTLNASFEINETSVIKCVAVIAGDEYVKEETIYKYPPFFMGSGQVYTDILTEDCLKELDGTIEGEYDVEVKHNEDYIFIIIPISQIEYFRRANLDFAIDMNGFEIPMESTETDQYVIYQSLNTYNAGTYNIDIDINS